MYAAGDPRAALAAPSERKVSAPTEFSAADYAKFYETSPRDDDANGRSWYVRGQNFILAYSEAKPGATFARSKQPDEYAIMIPDKDVSIEITAAGETVKVPGYAIAFVPPGDSRISVPNGGRIVRLFSYKCEDIAAKCSNAESYAKPHPNIPPFEPWPEPKGGYRIRHYSLRRQRRAGPVRANFPLHELHDQLSGAERRAARYVEIVAAFPRRFRAMFARARWRFHSRHPLALDSGHGRLARRRPRTVRSAVGRGDFRRRRSTRRERSGRM